MLLFTIFDLVVWILNLKPFLFPTDVLLKKVEVFPLPFLQELRRVFLNVEVGIAEPIKVYCLVCFLFSSNGLSGMFPYRLVCMIYGCRSPSSDVENPGNNLYVTGLSHRISKKDLERHFSSEGKVCLQKIFCM